MGNAADLIFTADPHEEGGVLTVKDINGDATTITITLKGVHSRAWRDMVTKRDRQFIKSAGKDIISDEEMFSQVTVCWENMPDPRKETYGEPLEFSVENARLMYEKSPIIFEQVNSFIANNVNFTRRSASK